MCKKSSTGASLPRPRNQQQQQQQQQQKTTNRGKNKIQTAATGLTSFFQWARDQNRKKITKIIKKKL